MSAQWTMQIPWDLIDYYYYDYIADAATQLFVGEGGGVEASELWGFIYSNVDYVDMCTYALPTCDVMRWQRDGCALMVS